MYPSFTMKYLVSNGTEEWIDEVDHIDYDDEDGNPIMIWKNKGCLIEGTSWKELGPSD